MRAVDQKWKLVSISIPQEQPIFFCLLAYFPVSSSVFIQHPHLLIINETSSLLSTSLLTSYGFKIPFTPCCFGNRACINPSRLLAFFLYDLSILEIYLQHLAKGLFAAAIIPLCSFLQFHSFQLLVGTKCTCYCNFFSRRGKGSNNLEVSQFRTEEPRLRRHTGTTNKATWGRGWHTCSQWRRLLLAGVPIEAGHRWDSPVCPSVGWSFSWFFSLCSRWWVSESASGDW